MKIIKYRKCVRTYLSNLDSLRNKIILDKALDYLQNYNYLKT